MHASRNTSGIVMLVIHAGLVSGEDQRLRGRQPRGVATRLSPAGHEPEPPRRGIYNMLRLQAPLPDRYTTATPEELERWIREAKAALGDRLLILGHHYQRP